MEQRVCRRCLLKELDGAYFQSVYEYIKKHSGRRKRTRRVCRAAGTVQALRQPAQRHVRPVRLLCGSAGGEKETALCAVGENLVKGVVEMKDAEIKTAIEQGKTALGVGWAPPALRRC